MPTRGVLKDDVHLCGPASVVGHAHPENTIFECGECGKFWLLLSDERGHMSWRKAGFWKRGRIRAHLAAQDKTVVGELGRGVQYAPHAQKPPISMSAPLPPPPARAR